MIIQEVRITMNKCPFFHYCILSKTLTCSDFNFFVNCPEYKTKRESMTKEKINI